MDRETMRAWEQAGIEAARGRRPALAAYTRLLPVPDLALPARLRLAALHLDGGSLREATAQALAAVPLPEADPHLLLALARQLMDLGEIQAGLSCLERPALVHCADPAVQLQAGTLLCGFSFYAQALQRLEHARRLGPDTPELWYQLGLARMYCGHTGAAEDAFNACLRTAPDFAPAARLLSTLRRQTPDSNHLDRLRASLARIGDAHPFAPLLHYALFKELDDLGDVDVAWRHLELGMRLRRRQLDYDEAGEIALFDALHRFTPVHDGATDGGHLAGGGRDAPTPVFILGMPRSGSTLLERFLCAHPDVSDAGELRDFTCQLRWSTDLCGGPQPDAALLRAAASCDLRMVGRRYLEHAGWRAQGRAFFIDKLPSNFLLAGLIAHALPQARIIDITRAPMDSCFSNLKALFADAYPHSYVQAEMARHYLRYRALMDQVAQAMPGRVLQVRYEALVEDAPGEVRRVLDFCGLPWSGEVMAPDSHAVIGTASTVQLREPVHGRYLGQWRRYARYLEPMQAVLGSSETE